MTANKRDDEVLLRQLNEQLDDSVDALDANTLSRLNQARHRALDEKLSGTAVRHHAGWLTAALATVFLAVSIVYLSDLPHSALDDSATIASHEDLELIDDLEFVSWLAAQDEAS